MEKEYEILESFNTSMGLIVSIRFFSKKSLKLERRLITKKIFIVLHSSPYQANTALVKRMEEGIYDCLLKPIESYFKSFLNITASIIYPYVETMGLINKLNMK